MTLRRFAILFCLLLAIVPTVSGQSNERSAAVTQDDPQAAAYLRRSLGAINNGGIVRDVTLIGTARRTAGSDDETGTATLKALVTGEALVELNFSSGPRIERRGDSSLGPVGNWTGPDGISQSISTHNLMTESVWFFPALMVRTLASAGNVHSYVGQETRADQNVLHITATRQISISPPNYAALMQHLSQRDIYLDALTLLPVVLTFNTHPNGDANLDIPVEIRFSDYRTVKGIQVPFHVERYLNGLLELDLQIETVELNGGVSASEFQIQ